jgi:hypothetical protein
MPVDSEARALARALYAAPGSAAADAAAAAASAGDAADAQVAAEAAASALTTLNETIDIQGSDDYAFRLQDEWSGLYPLNAGRDGSLYDANNDRLLTELDVPTALFSNTVIVTDLLDRDGVAILEAYQDKWSGLLTASKSVSGEVYTLPTTTLGEDFDGLIISIEPTWSETGLDARVRVIAHPANGKNGRVLEYEFVRSSEATSAGAWRLRSIYSCVLLSAASATVLRIEEQTGSQVSGGIMVASEAANALGKSVDPGHTTEDVYASSPWGPFGGFAADIHGNTYSLDIEFLVDGAETTLGAVDHVETGDLFQLVYEAKGYRSRNPQTPSTEDPATISNERITIEPFGLYYHESRLTAQEQLTCNVYSHLWCHNGAAYTHIRRPHVKTVTGVSTAVETIAIADYDENSYPSGDDDIQAVPWAELYNESSANRVRQELDAPRTFAVGDSWWAGGTLSTYDNHQVKLSNGKLYWVFRPGTGAPGTVNGSDYGVMLAGDTAFRSTKLTHWIEGE